MKRFLDPHSQRHVWVIEAQTVTDWPAQAPWTCPSFALFFAAEHVVDATSLIERSLAQGLVFVCAWGPGCQMIEEAFDELIVGDGSHPETNAIGTTSHPDESIQEALEFFLDAATPDPKKVTGCDAWVVLALGAPLARRVERALMRRRATPEA